MDQVVIRTHFRTEMGRTNILAPINTVGKTTKYVLNGQDNGLMNCIINHVVMGKCTHATIGFCFLALVANLRGR